MGSIRLGAVVAVLLAGCGRSPQPGERGAASRLDSARTTAPAARGRVQPGEGVFAFANSEGSEFLALDSVAQPASLRLAMCAASPVRRVVYAGWQPAQPGDDGRQTANNFAKQGGQVFRVEGGGARTDATCFLTGDSGLAAAAIPVGGPRSDACRAERTQVIARSRAREVRRCWPLATAGSRVDVLAVQFTTIDTSALASLVVADSARLLFADFPGRYSGPGSDVWRVDDRGEFSPEAFRILFLAPLGRSYAMGLFWAGTEGEDSYLLVADSADGFRTAAKVYRYWAPN